MNNYDYNEKLYTILGEDLENMHENISHTQPSK